MSFFLKSVLFENDCKNMLLCARGIFIDAAAICFFQKAYMVFETLLHLKECPLLHETLLEIETVTIVCLHPICTK